MDQYYKILWMPETFIIYRRKYDQNLRERLAEKYTARSGEDCGLENEWCDKFRALSDEKLERIKSIISMNSFKEED